ncbi:phosphoribosyl-ATP diphosphatase [Elioraea sp.]|jgi:phosphoribosyl-ATP pyrophosphohydrolase|uniref:phosphoribosyl-ATP diphosphatase n=1 Tax=Elioraea sp. TaxID=2185103 RepID=UPI003F6E63F9
MGRPAKAVKKPPVPDGTILDRLFATVEQRKGTDPALSHSARLLSRGTAKVAQKLGEEAVEAVIETTRGNRDGVIAESADLLYHLMVVWVDAGIRPETVWAELERRQGTSGIAEKAARAQPVVRRLPGTKKVW